MESLDMNSKKQEGYSHHLLQANMYVATTLCQLERKGGEKGRQRSDSVMKGVELKRAR